MVETLVREMVNQRIHKEVLLVEREARHSEGHVEPQLVIEAMHASDLEFVKP